MATLSLSFYAPSLERTVPLRALVPVDGKEVDLTVPQRPLPALYLLHGLYGSENDWFQNTRVALWARQRGLAVFCPAGENSFYTNQEGAAYLRFLGEDLPAFTRRMFPLSHRREDTMIAGLSMGGFGALNTALSYPQTFGKVAALSAALRPWTRMNREDGDRSHSPGCARRLFGSDTEDWDTLTLVRRCAGQMPEMWFSCGAQDALLEENRRLVRELEDCGVAAPLYEPQGDHNWDFWDREILHALDWMLPAP